MRDNIFLIMFCVLFIVLDTLVLGYSIGRIYPPISQQVSAQSTTSSVRKEKQEQKSGEQEEIDEDIEQSQEQEENQVQEDLLQEQNLSVSEQEQNIAEQQDLQYEQQTVTTTQYENTINTITEPVPYTYTREEINAMLVIDGNLFLESDNFEGKEDTDTVTDTDVIINGETCYMGVAFTGVSWNELMPYDDRAGFFVGNQSLKVYNERKEYIGIATENFLPALAKENQSHLEQ